MIKEAFNQGYVDALARLKIAAPGAPNLLSRAGTAIKNFGVGQANHLQDLGQGLGGAMLGHPGSGGQVWGATKGLLPSAAIAGGLGLGAYELGKEKEDNSLTGRIGRMFH